MHARPMAAAPAVAALSRTAWSAALFVFLVACAGDPYDPNAVNTGASTAAPVISVPPASITVVQNQSAVFTVTASGATPLAYQWSRDNVDIAGATQPTYTLAAATAADNNAVFTVRVSNSLGSVTSAGATLTVR